MGRPAIIFDQTMHLYQTGKEPICHNCPYYRCLEETGESGCPIGIGAHYKLTPEEILPLVKAARYHLETYNWPYSPANIRRMVQITAERKQLVAGEQARRRQDETR
jgi:hypothetical protein